MLTAIGQLASTTGRNLKTAQSHRAFDGYRSDGGEMPFTQPAGAYLAIQPAPIACHIGHDRSDPLGEVVHLERSRSTGLLVVMRLDDNVAPLLDDGDWWLSDTSSSRAGRPLELVDSVIHEVSLTRSPAGVGLHPVMWSRTDLAHDGGGQPLGLRASWRAAWDRAHLAASAPRIRAEHTIDIVELDSPARPPLVPAPTRPAPPASGRRSAPDRGRVYRHSYPGAFLGADPAA